LAGRAAVAEAPAPRHRVTHAQLGNRRTGRGLTVDPRSGEPINVQIPETRLD
jgi:S-DNA-T family DNA segregation ATPase FtsK/SpoIIIE